MIEPKPFIEYKEWRSLPEDQRPTSATCEIHGNYEIKPVDVMGRVIAITSVCPECSREYSEWSAEQEKIAKKKRDEELAVMMFEKRLRGYGVTPRHFNETFETYQVKTEEQRHALQTCQYVCEKITEGVCKNIIMVGSVGTGKTHLASAMCHYFAKLKERYGVTMATVTELIRYYRSTYSKDNELTEDDVISDLTHKDLLIIDELGTSKGDDKELNILFEVINNRYEYKKSTVIISNQSTEEVKQLLGHRIIDRLMEDGCRVLGMKWDSYRKTNKSNF